MRANKKINFLRSGQALSGMHEGHWAMHSGPAAASNDMDDQHASLAVHRALGALPALTRRVFESYRLGGITRGQLGQRFGLSSLQVDQIIMDVCNALEQCDFLLSRD